MSDHSGQLGGLNAAQTNCSEVDHTGFTSPQLMTLTYNNLADNVMVSIINRNLQNPGSYFQFRIQGTGSWIDEQQVAVISSAELQAQGGSMYIQVRVHITNPGNQWTNPQADVQVESTQDGLVSTAAMTVNIIGCGPI